MIGWGGKFRRWESYIKRLVEEGREEDGMGRLHQEIGGVGREGVGKATPRDWVGWEVKGRE